MRTCTEEDRENNKKEQKQSNKTLMSTRFSVLLFRYEVLFFTSVTYAFVSSNNKNEMNNFVL
jgi:hypothetical protein